MAVPVHKIIKFLPLFRGHELHLLKISKPERQGHSQKMAKGSNVRFQILAKTVFTLLLNMGQLPKLRIPG